MRMNHPIYHGTKLDEDPESFSDEVLKVVDAMGVTPREKVEYPLMNSKMWLMCCLINRATTDS